MFLLVKKRRKSHKPEVWGLQGVSIATIQVTSSRILDSLVDLKTKTKNSLLATLPQDCLSTIPYGL